MRAAIHLPMQNRLNISPEQVIRGELAGDRRQCASCASRNSSATARAADCRAAKDATAAAARLARRLRAPDVALAREKTAFHVLVCTRNIEDRFLQILLRHRSWPTATRPHRRPRDAVRHVAAKIDLVVDNNVQQRRGRASIDRRRWSLAASRASATISARSAPRPPCGCARSDSLDFVDRFAHAGGVETCRGTPRISTLLDGSRRASSRRAGSRSPRRRRQPIEKDRLADVGRADQHDVEAIAQKSRLGVKRAEQRCDAFRNTLNPLLRVGGRERSRCPPSGKSAWPP